MSAIVMFEITEPLNTALLFDVGEVVVYRRNKLLIAVSAHDVGTP